MTDLTAADPFAPPPTIYQAVAAILSGARPSPSRREIDP